MIFVSVGSREYQFDRLVEEIDKLVGDKKIKEEVVAQIGTSNYIPQHIKYERFMSKEDFSKYQSQSNLIITHGGTGAIISALKKEKQVISVPRLAKYKEHIDDHQLQVTEVLEKEGYLLSVINMNELFDKIIQIRNNPIDKRFQTNSNIINIIIDFIEEAD